MKSRLNNFKFYLNKILPHFFTNSILGHHDPRGAVYTDSGYISRLPSPRVVSSNMMLGSNTSDSIHSHALMEFGQFLDHDITANSKQDYECCNQQIAFQPKCFNIDIKGNFCFYLFLEFPIIEVLIKRPN